MDVNSHLQTNTLECLSHQMVWCILSEDDILASMLSWFFMYGRVTPFQWVMFLETLLASNVALHFHFNSQTKGIYNHRGMIKPGRQEKLKFSITEVWIFRCDCLENWLTPVLSITFIPLAQFASEEKWRVQADVSTLVSNSLFISFLITEYIQFLFSSHNIL